MTIVDTYRPGARVRTTQLRFEDFLEALVRVCTMKALPTAADLEREGVADGGQFMLLLYTRPAQLHEFVRKRGPKWNGELEQPIWAALEQLLWLLVRTIESVISTGSSANGRMADGNLTAAEAREFVRCGFEPSHLLATQPPQGAQSGLLGASELRAGTTFNWDDEARELYRVGRDAGATPGAVGSASDTAIAAAATETTHTGAQMAAVETTAVTPAAAIGSAVDGSGTDAAAGAAGTKVPPENPPTVRPRTTSITWESPEMLASVAQSPVERPQSWAAMRGKQTLATTIE